MIDTRIEALKIAMVLNPEEKDINILVQKAEDIITWLCS
jgi:hypothetical protein